jgi:hypothetical protein
VASRLRSVLGWSREERALFVEAWAALWAMRLALWVMPFRRLHPAPAVAPVADQAPREIARAVVRASRLVAAPTCLARALAARRLLARHGHASELWLGAAGPPAGRFEAHAWLECEGEIVTGGGTRPAYTALERNGDRE